MEGLWMVGIMVVMLCLILLEVSSVLRSRYGSE